MRRRAFTLIEMTVVVALIALFAAAIVPNLASQKAGQERRAFYNGIERIVSDARESAIETKRPVLLRFDDGENRFFLSQENDQGQTNEVGRSVSAPKEIRAEEFRAGDDTVASSDWQVTFYPDGTSEGGGVGVTDSEQPRSLEVDKLGHAQVTDGTLPDPKLERWQAGEIEQRT